MLFELAAGRRPFHSDNLMAIFYKITHEEANFDLIPQGADYDALMPILKKALAKNLDERYQTAYEFAVDLREWLKAHATTASSQNVLEALVDLEAPTHAPMPMTEAPGMCRATGGATVDLGPGRRPMAPRKGTIAPTRVGGQDRRSTAGAGADDAPGRDARDRGAARARASRRARSRSRSRASCPGWRWAWRSSRWASPATSRGRASRPPPAARGAGRRPRPRRLRPRSRRRRRRP